MFTVHTAAHTAFPPPQALHIMVGLFNIGLGAIPVFHSSPYPFWLGGMVSKLLFFFFLMVFFPKENLFTPKPLPKLELRQNSQRKSQELADPKNWYRVQSKIKQLKSQSCLYCTVICPPQPTVQAFHLYMQVKLFRCTGVSLKSVSHQQRPEYIQL